ncbi:MAG TPA: NAD(P)H-binding protein [Gemmatimonadaceae bacterium]
MKVALVGASGFVGSALLAEALSRGHEVTAPVSRPERIGARPNLKVVAIAMQDGESLGRQLAGHEAVTASSAAMGSRTCRGPRLALDRRVTCTKPALGELSEPRVAGRSTPGRKDPAWS